MLLRVEEALANTDRPNENQPPSKYESHFLANISHELRTPLNCMLILSKLLMKNQNGRLTDEELKWVATIYNSGTDLLKLINGILDFSAIEAKALSLDLEEVSLAVVSKQLEELFQGVASDKELEFSIGLDERSPERIYTDPDRLKQILTNLLSNAFKFTKSGWVKVSFYRPRDEALAPESVDGGVGALAISISDSGIGVAKESREAIFEAFRQEDGGTKRRFGGTGLGLSISKELAGLLGGELRMESEKGVGSTFTLYLPERTREPQEEGIADFTD